LLIERHRYRVWFVLLVCVGLAMGGCWQSNAGSSDERGADGALKVAVSILPHRWLVKQLTPEGVTIDVVVVVPPGESAETYQPSDASVTTLLRSDVYFRAGVPIESSGWFRALASRDRPVIVDLRDGLTLRAMGDDERHHHGHGHGDHEDDHGADHEGEDDAGHGDNHADGRDPHSWQAPAMLRRQAATMAGALAAADPVNADAYAERLAVVQQRLDAVDVELRRLLAGRVGQAFLVFHPAWGYFADAYGLRQVAVEVDGKAPGDHELTAFQAEARKLASPVLFVQPQFAGGQAIVIAEAIGASLVTIDPLGEDVPGQWLKLAKAIAGSAKAGGDVIDDELLP